MDMNTDHGVLAPPPAPVPEGSTVEPEDVSLNAGIPLPEEGEPEVLSTKVEGDAKVITDALAELQSQPGVATESNYNALSYLREDVVSTKGMSQSIAREAIAIIPGFGRNRPVGFYSKHISATGYERAIEEIDQAMGEDVSTRLKTFADFLKSKSSCEVRAKLVNLQDYQQKLLIAQVAKGNLRGFMNIAETRGFKWEDAIYQASAIDPTQVSSAPADLLMPREVVYAIASMDDYYMAHYDAPLMLEYMTLYLKSWKDAFHEVLDSVKALDKPKVVPVKAPALPDFSLVSGKKAKVDAVVDIFNSAYDKMRKDWNTMTTLNWVDGITNALAQAKVEDIVARGKAFDAEANELAGTLQEVASFMDGYEDDDKRAFVNTAVNDLLVVFTTNVNKVIAGSDVIVGWVAHATLSAGFAGTLVTAVLKQAWTAVNQCVTTMQMPADEYNALKAMIGEQ